MRLAGTAFLLFLLVSPIYAFSQEAKQTRLYFRLSYEGQPVLLDKWYRLRADSVSFETFRCYVSGVALYKDGVQAFKEDGYYLLDAADDSSMSLLLKSPGDDYDAVGFNIGIDSLTNSLGVQDGVLDPVNGMYWTWQAGYINLKLEGYSNVCPTRKNKFQFHLGGGLPPDYALQQVIVPLAPGSSEIGIDLPLDKFISGIDLGRQHTVMRPGAEAVQLSKQAASLLETGK